MTMDIAPIKRWSLLKSDEPVLALGELKNAKADIDAVIALTKEYTKMKGVTAHINVNLETSQLSPIEISVATKIISTTKALSIKLGTGYAPQKTEKKRSRDISIIKETIGHSKLVVASNNVNDANTYTERVFFRTIQKRQSERSIARLSWKLPNRDFRSKRISPHRHSLPSVKKRR